MKITDLRVRMPLATNTVVINFEQMAANIRDTAVDVVLLDTTFWGGIRACVKAAGVCETFQLALQFIRRESLEFSSQRCCISEQ